jgi:hypothetical protein
MCCCFVDDTDLLSLTDESCCENDGYCTMWFFIVLALIAGCLAVGLAGSNMHAIHKLEEKFGKNDDLIYLTMIPKVIVANIATQYYSLSISSTPQQGGGGGRSLRREHLSTSFLSPLGTYSANYPSADNGASGSVYRKAVCVYHHHSPVAHVSLTDQFSFDFTDVQMLQDPPSSNQHSNLFDPFDYLSVRVEIPFGTVLDQVTGYGYPGYGVHQHQQQQQPTLFPLPYATIWNDYSFNIIGSGAWKTTYGGGGVGISDVIDIISASLPSTDEYTALLPGEFLNVIGTIAYRSNRTNPVTREIVYFDQPLALDLVKCGLSAESSQRFECVFDSSQLFGKSGVARLSISFDYLVHPKSPRPTPQHN